MTASPISSGRLGYLDEPYWATLVRHVRRGTCVPFLGAGASSRFLGTAAAVANGWADNDKYPLLDCHNLAGVAQHKELTRDTEMLLESVREWLDSSPGPDHSDLAEIHNLLASLHLPVYVTTNFDDYLQRALTSEGKKPRILVPQWKRARRGTATDEEWPNPFRSEPTWVPTAAEPAVVHLHGHRLWPHTLVLTERNYHVFLQELYAATNQRRKPKPLLDYRVMKYLQNGMMLFVGYAFRDPTVAALAGAVEGDRDIVRRHCAVQLLPDARAPMTPADVRAYMAKYYDRLWRVEPYWGSADEFSAELRSRLTSGA